MKITTTATASRLRIFAPDSAFSSTAFHLSNFNPKFVSDSVLCRISRSCSTTFRPPTPPPLPPSKMDAHLPFFASGEVIRGFGRGSKDLGIPTANFPDEVVDLLPDEIQTGIFFGWAKVDDFPVHPMVVSIGKRKIE